MNTIPQISDVAHEQSLIKPIRKAIVDRYFPGALSRGGYAKNQMGRPLNPRMGHTRRLWFAVGSLLDTDFANGATHRLHDTIIETLFDRLRKAAVEALRTW